MAVLRERNTIGVIFRRSIGTTVLGAVVAGSLLASAILVGLRSSPLRTLPELPRESELDYVAEFGTKVAPLRRLFVRDVLGLLEPAGPPAPATRPSTPARRKSFERPRLHEVHSFTNDDMADAFGIKSIPFTGETQTATATRESAEPTGCSASGGTGWYRFQASDDEDLLANTFGSDYALTLGVFERSGDGTFTLVGCDRDLRGAALVQFAARSRETYWFQVSAEAAGGALVFNLEPTGVTAPLTTSNGAPGIRESYTPSVSSDGRYVAFESYATDLVADPPDEPCHLSHRSGSIEDFMAADYLIPCRHLYVRDRVAGKTQLASVSSSGEPANLGIDMAWISGNGRFVTFRSQANNLVAGDTNAAGDIFVRDLALQRTERVSISSEGRQATYAPTNGSDGQRPSVASPSISDDGRYVAFSSEATDLVPGDTNASSDVFVHDRLTGRTERVSLTSAGEQIPGSAGAPTISADGRSVSFMSAVDGIVPDDANGFTDLFLRDRVTGVTEIVSVSSSGDPGNAGVDGSSMRIQPAISADGRYVVFGSTATDLVPGDTNGKRDIFVRDRRRQTTILVSVSSSGRQGNDASYDPTIARDGRYVAFSSAADNLELGGRSDPTTVEDLYVHDIETRTTVHLPVTPRGQTELLEGSAATPFLSADGRTIVFGVFCWDAACGNYGNAAQVWVHDRPRWSTK